MTGSVFSVSLFTQVPGTTSYLFERINTLLESVGLVRFRIAVAYARWDGISLIESRLESFLKSGGEFQTIYGISNGVTTPDSLLYSIYLQEIYSSYTYAGVVEDSYANATFHPKFFEFRYPDKTITIIGSANLTSAGMSRNTEIVSEIVTKRSCALEKEMDSAWKLIHAGSQQTTLSLIRMYKCRDELGSEHQENKTSPNVPRKPWLMTNVETNQKPLFAKILDLKQPRKKSKILANLDTITARPRKLYLQILDHETGAQSSGGIGYQIQLPVATLGTFFGIGTEQTKQITFQFPAETITVSLAHFKNNTHRVRLRPLRDVPRPAIVEFRRIGNKKYKCTIVPSGDYSRILSSKCKEQTRKGSRKWGLD